MKLFLQFFLLFNLLSAVVFAGDYKEIKKISLKKDEQKKILVKYDIYKKLFQFRWTLYKNGGLVIHRSYDRVVGQNVLYLRHQNQSFRVRLKPSGADNYDVPYFLVQFKEFDVKKHEAKFDLLLFDKKNQIELKYLKK